MVFEPTDFEHTLAGDCGGGALEYYRRQRCTVPATTVCDYEDQYLDSSACLLTNYTRLSQESWNYAQASANNPQFDHTVSSGKHTREKTLRT